MDPAANIREQVELARDIVRWFDEEENTTAEAARLAELVLALDEWRNKGGLDPYRGFICEDCADFPHDEGVCDVCGETKPGYPN